MDILPRNRALPSTMSRLLCCLSFCVLVAAVGLTQTSATKPTTPIFKTTTHLVVLNVVVTDSTGKLVTNLTKDSFTVLENDQRQSIDSFEAPVAPFTTGQQAYARADSEKPETDRARTILVLDELNSVSEDVAFAANRMQKFLLAQPAVLVQPTSIYLLTKRRLEVFAEPTRDREALVARLKTRFIELPPHDQTSGGAQGGADRLVASLLALDEIALSNADKTGRKNVIWVGNGIPVLSNSYIASDDSRKFRNWVHYTANWLEETQTTVYTIDPRGVEVSPGTVTTGGYLLAGGIPSAIAGPDLTSGELVFESVATESGGAILRHRNDIDVAIANAVTDGSSYYTLSYYPSDHNWDGKFRRIQVKLASLGLVARTQRGYYAFPNFFEGNSEQIDFSLSRAVTSPVPLRSISFTATGEFLGARSRKSAQPELPSARLILKIQRDGLSWTPQPDGNQRAEVTLVTSEISSSGRVLGYKVREVELVLEKSQLQEEFANNPVELAVRLDLPARTDHIRLVVRDSVSGHLGTFDLRAKPRATERGHISLLK